MADEEEAVVSTSKADHNGQEEITEDLTTSEVNEAEAKEAKNSTTGRITPTAAKNLATGITTPTAVKNLATGKIITTVAHHTHKATREALLRL